MTATVQQHRTGVIIDDLWYGPLTPTGIYGGPQPTGAACTMLADVVDPVLITGPAHPAIPRARQPRSGEHRPNDRLGFGDCTDDGCCWVSSGGEMDLRAPATPSAALPVAAVARLIGMVIGALPLTLPISNLPLI